MNAQFEELLAKHLNGTLNEDEKQLLAMLLKVPENQLYLASKIDEQFVDENLVVNVDDEVGMQLFHGIQHRIHENEQSKDTEEDNQSEVPVFHVSWYQKKAVRWMAVAAASIILIVSTVVFWNNYQSDDQSSVVQNNKRIDSALAFVRHEVNTTGKDKAIQLPDGSLIILADKSEISYQEPFTNKRDITLIGKANFKVAKDQTKPFTVISDQIATTALGTEFTVTAFANAKQITVRLFEGKVVIKPVAEDNWRINKAFYLLPGQEFVYSDQSYAKVRLFKVNQTKKDPSMAKDYALDNPSIPNNRDGSWFMFNNQALKQVLDQLEAFYNVEIIYNKKDVQNINWTGNYNRSDSLETILRRIGVVHNLTVTKRDSAFIISK